LADSDFNQSGPIDLLIGVDSCAAVISSPAALIGGPSEPVGLHTVFGCVLFGKVSNPSQQSSQQSLHVVSNDNLQDSPNSGSKKKFHKKTSHKLKPHVKIISSEHLKDSLGLNTRQLKRKGSLTMSSQTSHATLTQ
jgi:hypothetical protein